MAIKLDTPNENFLRCEKVLKALHEISKGKPLVLTDDEDRENEGDVVFSAEDCSKEKIAFLAREARGLICLALEPSLIDKLELPLMSDTKKGSPKLGTAFTVSIEAKEGVTTGISASDRTKTILTAIADDTTASDLVVPGHIFPLRAKPNGSLERCGHTEASVDLMKLAGKKSAAVICEILKENGELARKKDLEEFCLKHKIQKLSIENLVVFRMLKEKVLEKKVTKIFENEQEFIQTSFYKSLIDENCFITLKKISTEEIKTNSLELMFEKSNSTPEESLEDLFSKALFSAKSFLSTNEDKLFVFHPWKGKEKPSLYEERKISGFVTNLLMAEDCHRKEIRMTLKKKKPLNSRPLDLSLAPKNTFSYKESL